LKIFDIGSEQAMEAFGAAIARATAGNVRIYLSGELAAGKTTLARGYLRARGHAGAVKSPTFTLVESYELDGRMVHHFDLYRIADPEELEYIGLDEYFEAGADCLVEWPRRGNGVLPAADLDISLEVRGSARRARVTAATDDGHNLLEEIDKMYLNSSI
jgi:tRNA threonylcarbamoyladenosine biosynthesis protein TsaE